MSLCDLTKLLNRERAIHRNFLDTTTVIPGPKSVIQSKSSRHPWGSQVSEFETETDG